jgi:hypothetical protein
VGVGTLIFHQGAMHPVIGLRKSNLCFSFVLTEMLLVVVF